MFRGKCIRREVNMSAAGKRNLEQNEKNFSMVRDQHRSHESNFQYVARMYRKEPD
jgi:hypothetical protein